MKIKRLKVESFRLNLFVILCLMVFFSCKQDYVPKPEGFLRIETGKHDYSLSETKIYSFNLSDKAILENSSETKKENWFNIVYPEWNAKIYCSYLNITPKTFANAIEDSHKFVYKHAVKADAINDSVYLNPATKVYGMLYDIKGNVASPVQFFLTDSCQHFFRGSLYFEEVPSNDSLSPIIEYIRQDIIEIMESFRWKNK